MVKDWQSSALLWVLVVQIMSWMLKYPNFEMLSITVKKHFFVKTWMSKYPNWNVFNNCQKQFFFSRSFSLISEKLQSSERFMILNVNFDIFHYLYYIFGTPFSKCFYRNTSFFYKTHDNFWWPWITYIYFCKSMKYIPLCFACHGYFPVFRFVRKSWLRGWRGWN